MTFIRQEDTLKHQGMRRKLILALSGDKDLDANVLEAMAQVPRHFFFDPAFVEKAYSDIAFQIGAKQTISHPSTVAYQTSLLEICKGDKVLEIGTGSGYQTCVLLKLGAKVFTIERQSELYEKTMHFLPSIGFNAKFFYGDGYKGLPTYGPFDKILVTCGAPSVPDGLLKQLKIGGIMVIPVGEGKVQTMTKIQRKGDDEFHSEQLKDFSFVPMLSDKA
ncbi:MAG: protein-L-isoaspartate(D-aspartate) O-methyltransferase [Bacteroidota bacterium]